MLCYRAVDTTADEEGGGRDEKYEKIKTLRKIKTEERKNFMYRVVRGIHPVGQGAFYTEIHNIKAGDEHCVVFDCGSKGGMECLEKSIKDTFIKDQVIDALVISHFDQDHVNGIVHLDKRCKIRNIVIPQFSNRKWFYIVADYVSRGGRSVNMDVCDLTIFRRRGIRTIEVKPMDDEDRGNNERTIELSLEGGESLTISSGTRIKLLGSINGNDSNAKWMYMPINCTLGKDIVRLEAKLNAVVNGFTSLSADAMKNAIENHGGDINKAYKEVFGNSNASSLCLYSGLDDARLQIPLCIYSTDRYWLRNSISTEACLYTGDSELRNLTKLNCIDRLLGTLKMRIGLVQIPHHGSIENTDTGIFDLFLDSMIVFFMSYGIGNKYGHPSQYLIDMLRTRCNRIVEVTQEKRYVEMIEIG